MSIFDGKAVLITGGTGSFGQECVDILVERHRPKRVIVFSRDELKQFEMRERFSETTNQKIRFFIGDVRDRERLHRAFHGVDIVIHAAALKQITACEYNPIEAVSTNITGASNVIDAAINNKVPHVLALSTDKAVNPINLYGATKLCAEKLFVQANSYSGAGPTRFSCTRYGNVVGSRGSVIPLLKRQREDGKITITDKRMTRFWITLEQGVDFVLDCTECMQGGEIFIPKIPSMNIMDLAEAVAPGCEVEYIGIRPGEKLHEVLLSEDEARQAVDLADMYIVQPAYPWWNRSYKMEGKSLAEDFRYASDTNERWLSKEEISDLIASE